MALVSSVMVAPFKRLSSTKKPPNPRVAAKEYAKIYTKYARSAQAGGGVPQVSGAQTMILEKTLYAGMASSRGSAGKIARAWANGVKSFWLSPPVAVVGAQSGVITAFPGQPALLSALSALFSNPKNTSSAWARRMASLLDTATKTVLATVTPPPGTIVPLV